MIGKNILQQLLSIVVLGLNLAQMAPVIVSIQHIYMCRYIHTCIHLYSLVENHLKIKISSLPC